MTDAMFPNDRFSSLIPETEKLHEELELTVQDMSYAPQTSREFGSTPVLHQFFPAWEVQAYVRMAKLTLHVHNSSYPLYETTGELPQLSDGNFLVPKGEIIQHLQTFHCDLDEGLDEAQKSESFAYRSMIHEKLERVMLYCRWVDPITYKEITRPQLKKHIPFPLNHFLPKKMHIEFAKTLQQRGIHTKEQAFVIARDCYASLNAKLANSSGNFFFGDRVSALDAAVFGHIADALSDPQLGKTVHQFAPLLVSHAERIRDKYFAMEHEANRPRSLSIDQLQNSYSHNQENYFAQFDSSFMKKVPASLEVTFMQPYRSLNWSRRELVNEIAKKKRQQNEGGVDEETAWHGLPRGQSFDKSTRNVIIGAFAAFFIYAIAHLPVQFNFVNDDDDEDVEYEEDDEDEY